MNPRGRGRPGRWFITILYIPLLYAIGWLLVQPLPRLGVKLEGEALALLGTALSFLLFLLTLPAWIRRRWCCPRPWECLGVAVPLQQLWVTLLRGGLIAAALLAPIALLLLLGGWARWSGSLSPIWLLNVLVMVPAVGLAEELVFRGWLWGELTELLGGEESAGQRALVIQAVIFGLAHTRFSLGWLPMLGLVIGLSLLGLLLALQRRSDGGSLWGAVGLHGGLVGGWSLLAGGVLELSPQAPAWLVGPGGGTPNPIGGVMGWMGLALLLWMRRRLWKPPSGGGIP